MTSFANQIFRYRYDHGLTQKALAAKLGMNQSSISDWENGIRYPSAQSFRKLKEITGYEFTLSGEL